MTARVAIVGAGASGTMLAIQLLRRTNLHVALIERGAFGRGVAYGTDCDAHLLNVRSGRMSFDPDAPGDFAAWLAQKSSGEADPGGFARRSSYGRYLAARLAEAEAAGSGRLERVEGEALSADDDGVTVADGRRVAADAVVLATGNLPPEPQRFPGAETLGERLVADPWATGALAGIGADDDVLLIGTGLTALDVLLMLDARGWQGRALALSRRGLLPRSHDLLAHPVTPKRPETGVPAAEVLHAFRAAAEEEGWGEVMEQVRPYVADLWRGATAAERQRFLRHLRPWWDVHRHRTAFEVGKAVRRMIDSGQVEIAGGRLRGASRIRGAVAVRYAPRGETGEREATVGWIVVCTGPAFDLARTSAPLLGALFRAGRARVDPLRLSLDVDDRCRLLDDSGRASENLYAMGPLTRGRFWEIVAVPDIREQALVLADRLGAQFGGTQA